MQDLMFVGMKDNETTTINATVNVTNLQNSNYTLVQQKRINESVALQIGKFMYVRVCISCGGS